MIASVAGRRDAGDPLPESEGIVEHRVATAPRSSVEDEVLAAGRQQGLNAIASEMHPACFSPADAPAIAA